MIVFFYIIEGVATYCESFVSYYFGNDLFDNYKMRNHGWKLAAILTVLILLLNNAKLFSAFTLLFAVLFVSLTECFIFNVRFVEALGVTGIYTIFLNIIDSFSHSILGILWNEANFTEYIISDFSFQRVVSLLLSKAILLLFYIVLRRVIKKFYYVVRIKYFLIVIFCGWFSWAYLFVLTINTTNIYTMLNWGLLFLLLCTTCSLLYLFINYKEEKDNRNFIQSYNSMVTKQYRDLMKSYKMNSQNFHDMQNHLLAIGALLKNKEFLKAQEYVEILAGANDFLEISWTGNEILDYILNIKKAKAIEEHIDFTIDADIIYYRKLSDTVLCTVLSNLLDNAIEANSRVCDAEKYIRVIIRTINDMLLIKIVNSAIEPIRKGKKFMTTKSDPERHGWGLKSVIEAVKSNNGEIYYNFKEKEFVVNIAFF
ncbi:GHKL domain-containing protein [Hungatella sp.]|uniref:sensor histidine kinase n=1 Tax=Hungatella sp. TaxID=2613924 RepID=UPI002A82600D|nr:GHKL domain-containing protein [Hungatella sp.]